MRITRDNRRMRDRLGFAALALILVGCPDPPARDQPTAATSTPALAPAIHGCHGLTLDANHLRCLLRKPKPLTLWLADVTTTDLDVRFESTALPFSTTLEPDGLLVQLTPPTTEGTLELLSPTGRRWQVELAAPTQGYLDHRKAALDLVRAGHSDEALTQIDMAAHELAPDEAALLGCEGLRIAYQAGQIDRVLARAESLASSAAISCAGAAHVLAAYVQLFDRPDFNGAQRHLDAAREAAHVDFETQIALGYLQGTFAHRLGRIDESLVEFDRSARLAEHVGDDRQYAAAVTMQAVALARLGRLPEAEQLAVHVEARVGQLEGAQLLGLDIRFDLAWVALLRREDDREANDPAPALEQLVASYAKLERPSDAARARLHLALAHLQAHELGLARVQLERIDAVEIDPPSLVLRELLWVRLELASGQLAPAREHLDAADLYAELNEDHEYDWQVWAARGALERASKNIPAALVAYRHARTLADQLALAVPSTAGRSMFVTTHLRTDAELLELLVESGERDEAYCVAVGQRARHLRSLWARLRSPLSEPEQREYRDLLSRQQTRRRSIDERLAGAWELPKAELAELRDQLRGEGEQADALVQQATALLERGAPQWSCDRVQPAHAGLGLLAMARSGDQSTWWLFLRRRVGSTLTTVQIEIAANADPDAIVAAALIELEPSLAELSELVIIPAGELATVDFHRALLGRASTAKLAPVYSLGLGLGESKSNRAASPARASVVAGADDLAAVDDEARAVAARLRELDWQVDASWSPLADDQPTLLHYAGHGERSGTAGWASAIVVPGNGRVSAAELVAGQRAPELVVLGACSTGSLSGEMIDGGMNLAAAFLLAGSELVIAPSGPVDDQTALELARALYRELAHPSAAALSRALADLQRTQLDAEPGPRSVMRWRAWTP